MQEIQILRQLVKQKKVIPFIGAGFSMPLGLPSWQTLIDFMATELGYDPRVFSIEGNALQLAEYYLLIRGHIGELRSRLDHWFNNPNINVRDSKQHMLLVNINAPIIYTTNYDNLIERAYIEGGKPFKRIVTVADIGDANDDFTQIIKFHGDLSLDESLVLAESHYFDRLSFETALDIKLRSDMIGKSLLFIGYSFQDVNLRYMWYRLLRLWKGVTRFDPKQPSSFIVGTGIGPVQKEIFHRRNIICIELEPSDPTASLIEFFESLLK